MTGGTPQISHVLWNPGVTPAAYAGQEKYHVAVLEQYKICIDMADKVSQRRTLTNTFFLTLNTAALTVIGVFWQKAPSGSTAWLLIPLLALLLECGSWFWLLCSYRQLSNAKFAVVGELEEKLPASPFVKGEWGLLGKGQDFKKYVPLTWLEIWVPIFFATIYIGGFIALAVA
ncbi:hypothetical protein ACFYRY_08765 [Streptomyces sp. NPDC005263]|uniref:RipA family octameric membrane protein n=1 Tax=Streptomyces sp. NPDC005263 TaxID=3364711 RepID=UPI0036CA3359